MRRVLLVTAVFFGGTVVGSMRSNRQPQSARPPLTAPHPDHTARVTLIAPDRTVRDLRVVSGLDRPPVPGEWGLVLVALRADGTRGQTRMVLEDAPPLPDLAP